VRHLKCGAQEADNYKPADTGEYGIVFHPVKKSKHRRDKEHAAEQQLPQIVKRT
jgi:hypothetical protein